MRFKSSERTLEWAPSAPTRRVPVAEVESEKLAVISVAEAAMNNIKCLDHCLIFSPLINEADPLQLTSTSSPSNNSALNRSLDTRTR